MKHTARAVVQSASSDGTRVWVMCRMEEEKLETTQSVTRRTNHAVVVQRRGLAHVQRWGLYRRSWTLALACFQEGYSSTGRQCGRVPYRTLDPHSSLLHHSREFVLTNAHAQMGVNGRQMGRRVRYEGQAHGARRGKKSYD